METEARSNNRPEELENRLVDFAVATIPISNRLGESFAGRCIAAQFIRSGTAAAPNYAEARSAESRADFIHKLRIAIKELNETAVWLKVIVRAKMLPEASLAPLATECDELRRIIGASIRTARLRGGRADGAISDNQ